MRLITLQLERFKNLSDFTIDWSTETPVSVLVGQNGAGKSNVLEALTLIFRDIDLGTPSKFAYTLKYDIADKLVELECDGTQLKVSVDGKSTPTSKLMGPAPSDLRPRFVFGYYSGPSDRLERHYRDHTERFYKDLLKGEDRPLRPLFYARNEYSAFVLLAFFLDVDEQVRQLLTKQLGIVGFDSALFVMRKPGWTSKTGDSRFWNARGVVSELLDRMYRISLAPMKRGARLTSGFSRSSRTELLYLFLPDLDAVKELAASYGPPQEFFKALESAYLSELVHDVRIRVRTEHSENALTFEELSEGEQQLLLVLGLMRFTREDEALFLLDEPDTHLNPAWSLQYRRFLDTFGGLDHRSQVVMATHDPLVVANLTRDEVRILSRSDEGKSRSAMPDRDPQGMGIGALLTSDVYGLRSQLDLATLDKLDKKRELAAQPKLTDDERETLRELSEELRDLGLTMEERDPEFEEYLKARAANERTDDEHPIVLTSEERATAEAEAYKIVKRLIDADHGGKKA